MASGFLQYGLVIHALTRLCRRLPHEILPGIIKGCRTSQNPLHNVVSLAKRLDSPSTTSPKPSMTQPNAEILSQGDELVTGEIADTNAAWLSSELTGLGFEVTRHTAVGDRLEALVELLREIAGRAGLCLSTGGLGPTCDDLTAEAVSLAFGLPLVMEAEALRQIETWFQRMNREMPLVNRKQALLPSGATRLDNLWGTAPGFSVTAGGCRFYFLPGVPGEMKAMFQSSIKPVLPENHVLVPPHRIILRTLGVGESALQEKLERIPLPKGTRLGFRTGGAENQIKLTFPPSTSDATLKATTGAISQALGDAVYGVVRNGEGSQSLVNVIGARLQASDSSLYLVETISGGLMASRCAGEDWFAGAMVERNPSRLLARMSMASESPAAATLSRLAESIRQREGVDYVLLQWSDFAATGLREENAQVEVCSVAAGVDGIIMDTRKLAGNQPRQRDAATVHGLNLLRRYLMGQSCCRADRPEE